MYTFFKFLAKNRKIAGNLNSKLYLNLDKYRIILQTLHTLPMKKLNQEKLLKFYSTQSMEKIYPVPFQGKWVNEDEVDGIFDAFYCGPMSIDPRTESVYMSEGIRVKPNGQFVSE